MRIALVTLALVVATAGAHAQNQPIQGPEDAACRGEAQSKVFGAPNPQGLSLYALGEQIYRACMSRSQPQTASARGKRRQAP